MNDTTPLSAARAFTEMAAIYLGEADSDAFSDEHRAVRAETARTLLQAAVTRLGKPLLTGKPEQARHDGATVDLAQYDLDPEYRAMIDARIAAGPGTDGGDQA